MRNRPKPTKAAAKKAIAKPGARLVKKTITPRSKKNNSGSGKKLPRHVLMPGGSRPTGRVRQALHNLSLSPHAIERWEKLQQKPKKANRTVLLETAHTFIHSLQPASIVSNPNWVAYAGLNNQSGIPVARMSCEFVVPGEPAERFGPTLFIFPGMQSPQGILQPILQWGITGMGGDDYWAIGSCFIQSQSSPVKLSKLTRVAPGQALLADIVLQDIKGGKFVYSAGFRGFPKSRIVTAGLAELKYCCVTLESYNVVSANAYPPDQLVRMRNIEIENANGQLLAQDWIVKAGIGAFGERAVAGPAGATTGNVDLYF